MIKAKIIADSKNEFGNRITTMVVTMPRYILAEFNTHRMLSRNSASSRAIPFEKMVQAVKENPFVPMAWQKDHKGMQGTEYLNERDSEIASNAWVMASIRAVEQAEYLSSRGATKQLCNRLLEPFMWQTVIVTATEWENFFALRCPQYNLNRPTGSGKDRDFRSKKDAIKTFFDEKSAPSDTLYWLKMNKGQADIHMMATAEAMWDAYNESIPKELKAGEWHIPFGDYIDAASVMELFKEEYMLSEGPATSLSEFASQEGRFKKALIKIATARCARVSYTVVGEEDKPDNYEADIKLHDRLASSGHWSPFEHCAQAMNKQEHWETYGASPHNAIGNGWSGNFKGFIQYRKTFQNENITANDTKRKS